VPIAHYEPAPRGLGDETVTVHAAFPIAGDPHPTPGSPWSSGSTDVRDRLDRLVRPITGHLDALGPPSWFARFAAPSMPAVVDGLRASLPGLPPRCTPSAATWSATRRR
jgi:hypothetical protein